MCLPTVASATLPFATVRGITLIPCRRAARTKCDKMICWRWIPCKRHVFVAFCDMRCDGRVHVGWHGTGNALCQCYRVVLLWTAQRSVHVRLTISGQAQHFVTWRRWFLDESQCQGRANMNDTVSKVVAGTPCCHLLEKWRRRRKNHIF